MSRGGFPAGELFTTTGVAGVIARVNASGATVQNPWVTLPGETGAIGGLYLDRTGVYGGDLLAVTTTGGVWRVNAAAEATKVASLETRLAGVTSVPEDPDRYGPWSGKILAGAKDLSLVYAIDAAGQSSSMPLDVQPQDIDVVPAQENFYAVDTVGRKVWGASDGAFAGIIGDILVTQQAPGVIKRLRWNGVEFVGSQLASGGGVQAGDVCAGGDQSDSGSEAVVRQDRGGATQRDVAEQRACGRLVVAVAAGRRDAGWDGHDHDGSAGAGHAGSAAQPSGHVWRDAGRHGEPGAVGLHDHDQGQRAVCGTWWRARTRSSWRT